MEKEREEVQAFDDGKQAWERLKTDQTWGDWCRVGDALTAGRARAMRLAHINQPVGRRYNEIFGAWLSEYGFDTIDKAVRSRLLDCMAHRVEIEAWRSRLTVGERLRYNHPDAVLRRWKAATVVPDPDKPKPLSPIAKLRASVIELEEKLREAERRDGGGSNIDFENDTVPNMAGFLARGLVTVARIRRLVRALETEAKQLEKG
jgi:hypothetical protein